MSSHPYSQELLPDDAGPSWQSRCINGLLRLLPIKAQTASAAAVQGYVRKLALRPAAGAGVKARDRRRHDRPTLAPRTTRSSSSCANVSGIPSSIPAIAPSRASFEG